MGKFTVDKVQGQATMALVKGIGLFVIIACVTSLVTSRSIDQPSNDIDEESPYCEEIAKATPQFCSYPIAKLKCAEFCARGGASLDCGIKGASFRKRSVNDNPLDDSHHYIIGGSSAEPGEWPWMVTLRYKGKQYCGGTVLSEHFILTAAHCFRTLEGTGSAKVWVIHAGDYLLKTEDPGEVKIAGRTEQVNGQYKAAKVIQLERPEGTVWFGVPDYDIAIVRLEKPLNLGKSNIGRVCLPDNKHPVQPGTCTVTGWGHTIYGDVNSQTNKLNEVEVDVISRAECNLKKNWDGHVNPRNICAGKEEGGKDACQYDSGGPLVCERNGVWYQEGISSSGGACGAKNQYGLYSNVALLKEWVVEAVLLTD